MPKKTRKDYDYYTLNIPNELRILFEAYLVKNPNLGFKSVSQYLLHVLQGRAEEIIHDNPKLKKIEKLILRSHSYILQENGTYKKVINKEKLLEKITQMWEDEPPHNEENSG